MAYLLATVSPSYHLCTVATVRRRRRLGIWNDALPRCEDLEELERTTGAIPEWSSIRLTPSTGIQQADSEAES